jgi:hypothetical protein
LDLDRAGSSSRPSYNAFNQVIWTSVNSAARFDPTGAQTNAQFGQITAAANPRIGQIGLRFVF